MSMGTGGIAATGVAEPTPVALALDALSTSLDHLVKIVEDGGLETLDDARLVGFLHGFERLRNRLPLVDHTVIGAAARRNLAEALQSRVDPARVRPGRHHRRGGTADPVRAPVRAERPEAARRASHRRD
jgi:hypothetical protein